MIGTDDPAVDAAFAAYATALDALDDALADDVAQELDAAVAELLSVAQEWEQLIDDLTEESNALAADGQTLSADLEARAGDLSQTVDTALAQLAGVEEHARGLQETFGTAREEMSEVLEAVAAVSAKAMSLGERLLGPASDLGVQVPQALEGYRQQLLAQANSTVETLSAECSAPATDGVGQLTDALDQVIDAVRNALQTSHDDLGSQSSQVLLATNQRSLGELQGLGSEVMDLVGKLKETAHTVTEIISTVGDTKDALVDGIKLTNSGVELIIGLLEELDRLLSGS